MSSILKLYMRDIERIDDVILQIQIFWKDRPGYRLSQIVSNAAVYNGYDDPFHMEDDEFLDYINESNTTHNNLRKDSHQINIILSKLEDYWKRNPDLRLAQIVTNASIHNGYKDSIDTVWFMTDNEFASYISDR